MWENQFLLEGLEARTFLSAAVDPVIEWNNVLIDTLRADRVYPGPGFSSRHAAMMHAAIYDAVSAIDKSHQPFLSTIKAPGGTDMTAAIAAAAWRVLTQVYPAQRSHLDTALATTLARVK